MTGTDNMKTEDFKYGDVVARMWNKEWRLTPERFVVTAFVDGKHCSFSFIADDGTLIHYPGSYLHVRDKDWIKVGEWDFENNKEVEDEEKEG